MIDTVRFKTFRTIRDSIPSTWEESENKYRRPGKSGTGFRPGTRHHAYTRRFTDPETGLRAWTNSTDPTHIRWVEVSLPRLRSGYNGKLIASEDDLFDALTQLDMKLRQLGLSLTDYDYLKRLDLVWQFRGDPKFFITAHRHLRNKHIRKPAKEYDPGSVVWKGSECRVTIYNKVLKDGPSGHPQDIVRVEVQLRGKRLLKFLDDEHLHLKSLSFSACYRVFRTILLGFDPPPVPKVALMAELLALGERAGWHYNGVSFWDIVTASKKPSTIRCYRREMAQLRPEEDRVDWPALLPPEGLPPVVNAPAPVKRSRSSNASCLLPDDNLKEVLDMLDDTPNPPPSKP